MSKAIDAKRFAQIKQIVTSTAKAQTAANRAGVSLETVRKVKNADSFSDYQAQNQKSHRQTKKPVRVKRSTPSKATPTTKKKRGLIARLWAK